MNQSVEQLSKEQNDEWGRPLFAYKKSQKSITIFASFDRQIGVKWFIEMVKKLLSDQLPDQ